MDSTSIAQLLPSVFDPIVIGAASLVTLAFLTGGVARFVEMLERT
jgi:hypothetical protein